MVTPEITTVNNQPPGDDKDVKEPQGFNVEDVESVVEKGSAPAFYSKVSVYLMMLFSGLALGSDGYNAAVMSNLNLMLTVIYPNTLSSDMKARLSNAFLIGMIVGMVGFGVVVDQIGRKTGAVLTTLILLLGIALSTGASGTSPLGLFWMLVVARGIAGVGAGGEYPVAGMPSHLGRYWSCAKSSRCRCFGSFR
jgi:MFS family permease